ncbi:arginyltransferase [Aliiglaciecola lipolytica]|uniref:Aspartate/glutamate leucyltransferase n=1 Tax=Aliiglaciecola lipolytica E3 TaxID=1127673 RepID=K6YD58_9ALTE|nr:arginyltransferase [Aliiglaciecola lipolytica]GAC14578.1 arginyl-tRNA-protein transferase [Aliiglaciecola lipolytica E3]
MNLKFGLTQQFQCSYLAEKQEQLLVLVPDSDKSLASDYSYLAGAGFRRSGDQIYRPHCAHCRACQSIRILVEDFVASKSQRRIMNKNSDLSVFTSSKNKPEYFPIYEEYINQRHNDGSMFPASVAQYNGFIQCDWLDTLYIEFYLDQELIGVAVTDMLENAFSALYTFFKPEFANRSLGTYAIIQQIEQSRIYGKQFLYLGYQIDECQKMSYKRNFYPHQRFIDNKWQLITKNIT